MAEKRFKFTTKRLEDIPSDTIKLTESTNIPKVEDESNISIDYQQVINYLARVKQNVLEDSGKAGHNPYLWMAQHLTPLETELKVESHRTPELYKKIMSLPLHPDTSVPMKEVYTLKTDQGNNPQIRRR